MPRGASEWLDVVIDYHLKIYIDQDCYLEHYDYRALSVQTQCHLVVRSRVGRRADAKFGGGAAGWVAEGCCRALMAVTVRLNWVCGSRGGGRLGAGCPSVKPASAWHSRPSLSLALGS